MSDSKYCYPDSDVLINKFDIRDIDKLHEIERKLTMLTLLKEICFVMLDLLAVKRIKSFRS